MSERQAWCIHWLGAIGDGPTCAEGHHFRVEAPTVRFRPCFGLLQRKPADQREPCDDFRLPTAEELEAERREDARHMSSIFAGKCPTCGTKLIVVETERSTTRSCPTHGLLMRSCRPDTATGRFR